MDLEILVLVSVLAFLVGIGVSILIYSSRKRNRQSDELVERAERVSKVAEQTANESKELLQSLRNARYADNFVEAIEDVLENNEQEGDT